MNLSNSATNDTLTISGADATSITGIIANGGTSTASKLTYSGTGSLTLSGANTYGGITTLSSTGTLNINNATALGTGAFTISGAATINNTSGGAITLTNNNAQNWNSNFTFTGTSDLNLGTGAVTLNATRTVTVNGGDLTVGGVISGTGFGITKAGTGMLTLSGANAYTGSTTL
ncbi:MAG TPA: autotransporter-associated beta strand repeat-containing protein, partial [Opitutaceae bacterium]|nr:autotransporter-associated beta strand repeat-containing protein [Opitutaceae bacterium]